MYISLMINDSIILIFVLIIFFYGIFIVNYGNVTYVESYYDGNNYLVQNTEYKEESAVLLSKLIERMKFLREHLKENIEKYSDFKEYINLLSKNFNDFRTSIYEGNGENNMTSYAVNKGEEVVFCLHSKNTNKLHDINLLMYVAIHEMAHMACPEVGHGDLFKKIFNFMTLTAIDLKIYTKIDFELNNQEYCGMMLTTSIV